jgi:hypothetical protein
MGPRATSQCAHALRRHWAHLCVSECCLVQSDCFIQREQVTFYKMVIMPALYYTTMLDQILILIALCDNSPLAYMSIHWYTVF